MRRRRVARWLAAVILLASIPLTGPLSGKVAAAPDEIFASRNGSGTVCSHDLPCSLIEARNKARDTVQEEATTYGRLTGNLIVNLLGGVYELQEMFTLGPEDSGRDGFSVIYRNYGNETVVFSGGAKITGWQSHGNGIFKANVGTAQFRQLYVNGARAVRAREPDLENPATGGPYLPAFSTNPYRIAAAKLGSWANHKQVEFVWLAHWNQKRARIESYQVIGTEAELTFKRPERDVPGMLEHDNQDNPYYYLENAYELLNAENEWYLDESTGWLYYKPAGGTMANLEVIVPRLPTLVEIKGTDIAPAHHIQLQGIYFQYGGWTDPSNSGYINRQAGLELFGNPDRSVPGAVQITHAHHVRFEGNVIQKTGAHGLLMKGNLHHNVIAGNTFRELSAGGIYVNSDASSFDTILDNTIERIGRDYTDTVGILATKPDHMSIEFNLLRELPYSGISIGWQWNDADTGTTDNQVQYNRIQNVMQLHDDGGGIYTLGRMQNSKFHHNYVSDIVPSIYNGGAPIAGIYLDRGSTGKAVTDNVLKDTVKAFHMTNSQVYGNTLTGNYYNVDIGRILPDNTVGLNTQIPSGGGWPADAQTIMLGSGLAVNQALLKAGGDDSSSWDSTFGWANAADGSTDEKGWSPCGYNGTDCTDSQSWWTIDLGDDYRIRKIEIVSRLGPPGSTFDNAATRRNFKVKASNDPQFQTGVVTLAQVQTTPFPHNETWSAIVTDPGTYRYIVIGKTAAEYFYLNEVRIYR